MAKITQAAPRSRAKKRAASTTAITTKASSTRGAEGTRSTRGKRSDDSKVLEKPIARPKVDMAPLGATEPGEYGGGGGLGYDVLPRGGGVSTLE